MPVDVKKAAAELAASGENATYEIPGGALRFVTNPDTDTRVNDFDCYGKVSRFYEYRERDTYTIYPPARPDGFDGGAYKVCLRDGYVWWQPEPSTPDPKAEKQMMADLLEYGFQLVGVELIADEGDFYGHHPVRDAEWLGGVEPFADDDHLASILEDLISEVCERSRIPTTWKELA